VKIPVVPYSTPPAELVTCTGWWYHTSHGDGPLPDALAQWDYLTRMTLSATVALNLPRVLRSCRLRPGSSAALVVTAASDHTRTERRTALVPLHPGTLQAPIQFDLDGAELGGRLTLTTLLVATDPDPVDDLGATEPGSILWRHQQHTRLQGHSGQFPTDAEDFGITRPHLQHAGWVLRVDTSDPETAFLQAVRLTLNSSNRRVAALLGGEQGSEVENLGRLIDWDVTRQLVTCGLDLEEVVAADVDTEGTSLAAVLRNMVAAVWPSTSPATVREWRSSDPERFEAHLLNHGRIP